MNIQSLLESGYSLLNIQELISLFQSNINNYQDILNQENQQNVLSTLHKLKGGLRVLQLSKLVADIDYLEHAIGSEGLNQYRNNLIDLINECNKTLNLALIEIEELLAQAGLK